MKKLLLTALMFFFLTTSALAGLIDINTANQATLESLPHVGPTKAAAIIEYRKNHPFKSVEDLANVKGIGTKTVEKLKGLITVSK